MAISLFYNEQATVDYYGKDQRSGTVCTLDPTPTITKTSQTNVRPRGADIVDISQDGNQITITANGNGTGTVTVAAYLEKNSGITLLTDTRVSDGSVETNVIGSKSIINSIGISFSTEVTVLEPKSTIELDGTTTNPEIDCQE